MKYYSEITKKIYDSERACKEEENKLINEQNQKAAARKADADKVEKALATYLKAAKEYRAALSDFCSKHGTYHKSISTNELTDDLEDWIAMINMM